MNNISFPQMEIKYRPGKKQDCPKIAELINIASEGVVEYLFHDLVPGATPVQAVAHSLGNENSPQLLYERYSGNRRRRGGWKGSLLSVSLPRYHG